MPVNTRRSPEHRFEASGTAVAADASTAQCQHIRAISAARVDRTIGNIGLAPLAQIREILALILDIPS